MERTVNQAYIGATNIISSLGFSTQENFINAWNYQTGIQQIDNKLISDTPFMGAPINKSILSERLKLTRLATYTTLEQLFILSISDVLNQSKIDLSKDDCAIIFSTTKGNIDLLESNTESLNEDVFLSKMAKNVANYFKIKNEPIIVSNACISGVSATVLASRFIREGKYKNIIVTGGDLLTSFVLSGFTAFKSISLNPCIPYDETRDGLSLGEGCATILVTAEPTLSSGVIIEGGAITNDANHISGPSRTGDGLCYAMEQAMAETDLKSTDLSFINAHGTATPFNDEMESKAINLAGLNSLPVNSLKSYFGHTLGAAGVIELVICIEELRNDKLLATKGFTTLGVPESIIVSGKHQPLDMKRCIKTASGFGGCNGAIVLALEKVAKPIKSKEQTKVKAISKCSISNGEFILNNNMVYQSDQPFGEFIRGAFKTFESPNMKFFKMDDLCKLGYIAAEALLKDKSYNPTEIAIVLGNQSSSLDTDIKHQNILNEHSELGTSPAIFVYTLPNVVLGEICIRHKIQGENTFFIQAEKENTFLAEYASQLLSNRGYKAVIYGWCDFLNESYNAELTLLENE